MDHKVSFIFSATILLCTLCACSVHSASPKKHLFQADRVNKQESHEEPKERQFENKLNSHPTYHHQHHSHHPQQHPTTQESSKDTLQVNTENQHQQQLAQNVRITVPNLPPRHYQFWLRNHPRAFKVFEEFCSQAPKSIWSTSDPTIFQQLYMNLSFENPELLADFNYAKTALSSICSKIAQIRTSCWGYENNCQHIYLMPECSGSAEKEQEKKIAWFTQADFGYVLERRKEMSKYCSPGKIGNRTELSSFECTKHFTSCRGDNLFIQFKQRTGDGPTDIEKIGALKYCDLQKARISEEAGKPGRLESWFGELGNYDRIDANEICDIRIDKQVFFVKIDSSDNFYKYLGTFINLYATIHLNNRFSSDNQIVIWDERAQRNSTSEEMWAAFSWSPPINVGDWAGKKVCLDKPIFAMPPRMSDGLLSRETFIEGCLKSGLFTAFHEHIIHRLKIPNLYTKDFHMNSKNKLIRLSIISKSDSKIGRISNGDELEQRIRNESTSYFVQQILYDSLSLSHVLALVLNSDIIIGLDDPGLSYALFAPDWASLIELKNHGKPRHENLARLRGISYFTPDNNQNNVVKKVEIDPESDNYARLNSSGSLDHNEYNDYTVDVDEFMTIFFKVRDRVVSNRENYFNKLKEAAEVDHVKTETYQNPVSEGSDSSFTTTTTSPTTTTSTTTVEPTTTSTTTIEPTTTSSTTDPTSTTSTDTTAAPSQAEVLEDESQINAGYETSESAPRTEL